MPSPYSVVKAKHASMAAGGTAEQVTISGEFSVAEFVNRDATRSFSIKFAFAAIPAVTYLQDDSYIVPPGGEFTMVDLEASPSQSTAADLVVSLISDGGTPAYSVQAS